MSVRGERLRLSAVAAVLALLVAGCSGFPSRPSSAGSDEPSNRSARGSDGDRTDPRRQTSAALISSNVRRNQQVTVDTAVSVDVARGTLDSVVVRAARGGEALAGSFNATKTRWTATDRLEPGTRYLLASRAVDAEGRAVARRTAFATERLGLDRQTYASITPLDGETVGVGMPVIVRFDLPVIDRAAFERHMSVTARPATVGSWHWLSSNEVHWRPRAYWKPGTSVDVRIDVNSLDAGNGVYGQMDRHVRFQIGRSVVMRTDVASHSMKVYLDGALARTVPVTAGKPGFETRSGVKLIVEKFAEKRMDAATVGIDRDDPEYYDIPDVEYAQRVTFTGEFLHAAPWSTSAQGSTNVSHGCIGMSTEDARWLFDLTHRGDPVEVTGTTRALERGNGWTDWNSSFAEYREGSAL